MSQLASPSEITGIASLATETLVVVVSGKPAGKVRKPVARKKSGYRHSEGPIHKERDLKDFLKLADRIEHEEQTAWNSRMVSIECLPEHPLKALHYSELERRYGHEYDLDSDSSLCQEFLVLSGVSNGSFVTRIPSTGLLSNSLASLL